MQLPATPEDLKSCPLSDQDVVERVKAGDISLFEVLMRRHNQRVYRVARSILGYDTEAEDVMQEAYVRAYVHLDQLPTGPVSRRGSPGSPSTKHSPGSAIDRYDTIDAESEPSLRGGAACSLAERDPERRMFDREMKTLLEAAIGLTTAETAECIGASEDVVKTRLHLARSLSNLENC